MLNLSLTRQQYEALKRGETVAIFVKELGKTRQFSYDPKKDLLLEFAKIASTEVVDIVDLDGTKKKEIRKEKSDFKYRLRKPTFAGEKLPTTAIPKHRPKGPLS